MEPTNELNALERLSELHKSGELTNEQFEFEKAKLMGAPQPEPASARGLIGEWIGEAIGSGLQTRRFKNWSVAKRLTVLAVGAILFVVAVELGADNRDASSSAPVVGDTATKSVAAEEVSRKPDSIVDSPTAAAPAPVPILYNAPWEYDQSYDDMRKTTTRYATIESTNELNFDFPYNGGSHGEIGLRKIEGRHGSPDVMLKISKGQFNSAYDGVRIAVKFDDKPLQYFTGSESSDGSADILFLSPESRFVSQLKKAKTVMIEAPFYQEGRQQMSFDVTGLEFPY